jgi:F420-dependent oxidoreductase-like protein
MQLRIVVEPHQGARYTDIVRAARCAEEAGFDGFFRSDHLLAMGDADGMPGPTEAWTTLAGIARETSRLRIGTLVSSATFRHPAVLAVQVAQVDEMSGGRVELGLGSGWFAEEHRAFGIEFPDAPTRFERFEEQLQIIRGMWSCPPDEKFTFEGDHYQLFDCPGLPKPLQADLPLIVGGLGPRRTPMLAARYATEFNVPLTTPEETRVQISRVRQACVTAGRRPDDMVFSAVKQIACGRTEREFAARAAAAGSSAARFRAKHLAGTPDEVVERIGRFAKAGCRRLYVQLPDLTDLDHLTLIAEEVMRQLPVSAG